MGIQSLKASPYNLILKEVIYIFSSLVFCNYEVSFIQLYKPSHYFHALLCFKVKNLLFYELTYNHVDLF
jgi:hypothetical protein